MDYTSDKRRDQSNTSFSTCHGLSERKKQGEVTMNIIITLKLASRLDTFPRRCNLDQNTVLVDTDRLVETDELLCL